MTHPTNPMHDEEFAKRLRRTDQPISLSVDQLTQAVATGRNRRKARRAIVLATLPAICLLIGLASIFSLDFSTVQPVATNAPKTKSPTITTESHASTEQLTSSNMSDSVLDQIVLDFQRAKLAELRAEIESLKQAQALRDWELKREFVSRSEVAAAASQIKHAF